VLPSTECFPARETSLQHRASVLAHGCDAHGIRGQAHERIGKRVGVAGFDDEAARVLLDQKHGDLMHIAWGFVYQRRLRIKLAIAAVVPRGE